MSASDKKIAGEGRAPYTEEFTHLAVAAAIASGVAVEMIVEVIKWKQSPEVL